MSVTDAIDRVPDGLKSRSGALFYSGRGAFDHLSDIYLLGLNPGGSPATHPTIEQDIAEWQRRSAAWSAYVDDSWAGKPAGECGMQPRVRHMFDKLKLDLRTVPASNVVFVRTKAESHLKAEKSQLLSDCWQVHDLIIRELGVRTIVCLGRTAGKWCREKMGADQLIDQFREKNKRGWISNAHLAPDGRAVVTVTHPSRADWSYPAADPTPLVKAVLDRPYNAMLPDEPEQIDNHRLRLSDIPDINATWGEIERFALTYNGYEMHGSFEACAAVANARRNQTVDDLRTCLFFQQRAARHSDFDVDSDPDAMKYVRSLVSQLRVKVTADRPGT